jgi:hypothetical protein
MRIVRYTLQTVGNLRDRKDDVGHNAHRHECRIAIDDSLVAIADDNVTDQTAISACDAGRNSYDVPAAITMPNGRSWDACSVSNREG